MMEAVNEITMISHNFSFQVFTSTSVVKKVDGKTATTTIWQLFVVLLLLYKRIKLKKPRNFCDRYAGMGFCNKNFRAADVCKLQPKHKQLNISTPAKENDG